MLCFFDKDINAPTAEVDETFVVFRLDRNASS